MMEEKICQLSLTLKERSMRERLAHSRHIMQSKLPSCLWVVSILIISVFIITTTILILTCYRKKEKLSTVDTIRSWKMDYGTNSSELCKIGSYYDTISSLKMNYGTNSSELCEIGSYYDTDKSSQRKNTQGHVHPYTLFYEGLFVHRRNDKLKIAELGILDGASLLMWREYFPNAEIYGFEYNHDLIHQFKKSFDNNRITLAHIDVTSSDSIVTALGRTNVLYDIIIEDTTHQMDDQIRVIERGHKYLKPGGVLIIEDIFRRYDEKEYLQRLQGLLKNYFQDYYFIDCDHVNARSPGWDNDKLFILTKKGAEPLFKTNHKITIITPSCRMKNLPKIRDTIRFEFVDEWIIVYDGKKIKKNPRLFAGHDKIREHVFTGNGISGNPQRNHALELVSHPNTSLYFLDDDNVIHPDLYRLLAILDNRKMYTFNQVDRLKGGNIQINHIDTAMTIIPYSLCRDVRWIPDKYNADGYYIKECYEKNRDVHVYVDDDLCYYNRL